MVLDLRGPVPKRLPFRKVLRGTVTLLADEPQGLVMPAGAGGILVEYLGGRRMGHCLHETLLRISAICIVRTGLP